MKLLILFACLTSAIAFSVLDVNFDELVPIHETVEWQQAHPELAKQVAADPSYQQRAGRVWGGRNANPGELPYQVGILILLTRQSFCGGSIVSNNFVVTAAQCFPGDPNAVVEIGSVDRNTVQEFINAAEKILHPAFNVSTSEVGRTLSLINNFSLILGGDKRQ